MKVSRLNLWKNKEYAKTYLEKGLKALKVVALQFLYKKENLTEIDNNNAESDDVSTPPSSSFYTKYFADDDDVFDNGESRIFLREQALTNEINIFCSKIENNELLKKIKSTNRFWKNNCFTMPLLHKLTLILSSICSSSASVERFFSLTGFVCDRRRLNMKSDLIIIRSLLKTNFHLLNELSLNNN